MVTRFNSYAPPHFGRGKLQAEAAVRRSASKAVLGSPGATPASTQSGGRPPAPETLAPAHPGDPCPESAEGAGPPAERSRRRAVGGPGLRSGLVPERALQSRPDTPATPPAPSAGGRAGPRLSEQAQTERTQSEHWALPGNLAVPRAQPAPGPDATTWSQRLRPRR
jgi:hypothetical protein